MSFNLMSVWSPFISHSAVCHASVSAHLAVDSVPAHWTLQTVLDAPDQVRALVVRVRLLPNLLRTLVVI